MNGHDQDEKDPAQGRNSHRDHRKHHHSHAGNRDNNRPGTAGCRIRHIHWSCR